MLTTRLGKNYLVFLLIVLVCCVLHAGELIFFTFEIIDLSVKHGFISITELRR